MHPDLEEILYTEEEIKDCVQKMGAQITRDYQGKDLIVISVLRGAAIFMADLVRSIELPMEMDFMAVSSYGSAAKSSGVVRIIKDLSSSIEGKDVLIAEDIFDSGLTLKYLMKTLHSRSPRSLEVATLFCKEGKKEAEVDCKYIGFNCPDRFIVGYGLDYAERYRNLPYVGVLKEQIDTL
ncbi:MAG: hypoxanthine phosphoribosyltransferase [Coriobacteriaceae bacterium]|nr:hypoxanthine phosphoribosyltransferase [Coriobacteriaceae bacterium]